MERKRARARASEQERERERETVRERVRAKLFWLYIGLFCMCIRSLLRDTQKAAKWRVERR